MKVGFLREAGGHGDCISVSAAIRAYKMERPKDIAIMFAPEAFCELYTHLEGIDRIVSIGSLKYIQSCRRQRGRAWVDLPYTQVMKEYALDRVVDFYCPGFDYELHANPYVWNRDQVFASVAGVRDFNLATPKWIEKEEDCEWAQQWLINSGIDSSKPLIGLHLRATGNERSYPHKSQEMLMNVLGEAFSLIYFDCIEPRVQIPPGVKIFKGTFEQAASVLKQCKLAVVVDSSFLHLSEAVGTFSIGLYGNTFGSVISNNYFTLPLNGSSAECTLPCMYRKDRNWDRDKCRAGGCSRIRALRPDMVFRKVQVCLEKLNKWQNAS